MRKITNRAFCVLLIAAGVIFGMIIYKAFISLAMLVGLESKDTNLVVALLFIVTLVLSRYKGKA